MIIPGQHMPIVVATRPVDFRFGHNALAATVQNQLGLDPHSGLTVVFRSKRADRVKILGDGDLFDSLKVSAHAFSDSAERKIKQAGGSVTVIDE